MPKRGYEFHAVVNPARAFAIDLYAGLHTDDGRLAEAQPVELKVLEGDERHQQRMPFASLQQEEALNLMDRLWEAGVRPSQVGRNVDEVSAVKGHLEDMRQIAFAKMGVDKP